MDDPNKLHHIFGNPKHNLDAIVRHYGGEGAAARALLQAVVTALQDGSLVADTDGHYKQVFHIRSFLVWISGKVVNGVPRIGSAWVRA
jgi:hypothetical protein